MIVYGIKHFSGDGKVVFSSSLGHELFHTRGSAEEWIKERRGSIGPTEIIELEVK